MLDKIISLAEAVALVPDAATLSLGGFTTQRHPMAFVHELIRQQRRNLYLFGHSPGGDWDHLIGAGCVRRVELAYEADEAFGTIGPCWRRAVEQGTIEWEDYTNFSMVARFSAGAMGLPFLPIRAMLGSSLIDQEGLSPEQRHTDPRTASQKLQVMDCPFTGQRVVLVPAITTDFCILHVQKASANGTIRIQGQLFADVQQALAARTVIVTTEAVVDEQELRADPAANQLPYFRVHHVVPVHFGAHPYAVFGCYDYDPLHLKLYHASAQSPEQFREYLEKYVLAHRSHTSYLEAIGGQQRLKELQADATLGYRTDLVRRV